MPDSTIQATKTPRAAWLPLLGLMVLALAGCRDRETPPDAPAAAVTVAPEDDNPPLPTPQESPPASESETPDPAAGGPGKG